MEQFSLEKNELRLRVAKSPLIIRFTLYFLTFLCFALPLFGIILNLVEGNGIKFGFFLMLSIFSVIGYYLIRISIWNHFGQEIIQYNNNQITYIADYRWFKESPKTIEKNEPIYSIKNIGFEDDNKGVLIISNGSAIIESVVIMPKDNLIKLITILQNSSDLLEN